MRTLVAAAVASITLVALSYAQDAKASIKQYQIAAQPLGEALRDFAAQSDMQLIFSESEVVGAKSTEVDGQRTAQEALGEILKGTDLRFEFTENNVVVVKRLPVAPAVKGKADTAAAGREAQKKSFWERFRVAEADAAASGVKEEESTKLEEVVVTAQKRKERLLDVPGAISVLSGDRLEALKVNSIADMASFTPGLTVSGLGVPGARQISLRGLNSGYHEISTSAMVGTYIDDMPVGAQSGARGGQYGVDLMPYDIADIEVLKGPQGTFYGSNAMGGLVKYTLRKPNLSSFEARAGGDLEGITSGDKAGWSVRSALNAPLVKDTLAVRLSGFYRYYPGYIDNITLDARDTNHSEQKGGIVSLLWQVNDDLAISGTVLAQDIDANDAASVSIDGTTIKPLYNAHTYAGYFEQSFRQKTRNYNIGVDWDLGFAKLVSSTGWSVMDNHFPLDLSNSFGGFCAPGFAGYSPGCPDYPFADAVGTANFRIDTDKVVQEVRFASPAEQRLQWMLGAFYTYERSRAAIDFPPFTPELVPLDPQRNDLFHTKGQSVYKEKAIFANATYALTPRFDVSAGARYSSLGSSDQPKEQYGIIFGGQNNNPPLGSTLPSVGVTTWMGNARYHLTPNAIVYARVATGYRPGSGCKTRSDGSSCRSPLIPESSGIVDPDRTTNYEVGFKGEVLDRRLMLDMSAFWIDWTDIQLNQISSNGLNYAGNGGKAVSRGVELATTYRISNHLRINGSLAYTDAYLAEDALAANGRKGDQLPVAARWTGSAALDYELPLDGTKTLLLGGSYRFRSKVFSLLSLYPNRFPIDAQNIVDLSAGMALQKWTGRLYTKNVFNDKSYTGLHYVDNFQAPVYVPIQPRTVGVSVDYQF